MRIFTADEITAISTAELSAIAQTAYEAPELEARLTSEITAKRAEITALKRNKPATKAAYFGQLENLGIELQKLIADDEQIQIDNAAAIQAARDTAAGGETDPDNQTLARISAVNSILRESDWIVTVDAQTGLINLTAWLNYRADLRAWAMGTSDTIPDSPAIPDIDLDSETVLERIESQDNAILGVLEMML